MIKTIYLITIGILIIISVYLFVNKFSNHKNEIDKINKLEDVHERNYKRIKYYRSKTTPCDTANLKNPRDCYFGSNYKCSWDTNSNRCNRL